MNRCQDFTRERNALGNSLRQRGQMKRYGDGPARREVHFTKKKERVNLELPAGQKSPLVAYAAPRASVFTAECVM